MHTIHVTGKTGHSRVMVGEALSRIDRWVPDGHRPVIITDHRVQKLYGERFPSWEVIPIGEGEGIKTLDTVREIYRRLIAMEADRTTFLVGIGGGIVCDITGFAAATYLRGVPFGFAATTLLAQVDASVGGKNGVNLDGYKNMVGVFQQPAFVICDPALLATLDETQWRCGLAETLKHAAIADERFFRDLEAAPAAPFEMAGDQIEKMICDAIAIKARVVDLDEREQGERRKLNFGHTFGHAIEKTSGVSHGSAVSAGMTVAVALSCRRGYLSAQDARRFSALQHRLRLPVHLKVDAAQALDAMRRDKKREGEGIHFVLLEGIGRARVEKITLTELAEIVHEWAAS